MSSKLSRLYSDDRHRPHLSTPWTEGNDYINAVFVHVSTHVNEVEWNISNSEQHLDEQNHTLNVNS